MNKDIIFTRRKVSTVILKIISRPGKARMKLLKVDQSILSDVFLNRSRKGIKKIVNLYHIDNLIEGFRIGTESMTELSGSSQDLILNGNR